MSLQQNFMQSIANTVFGQTFKQETDPKKRCFLRRFDPENQFKKNTEIAELIKKDMSDGYYVKTMARTLRDTIKALVKRYEAEINIDGINPESWMNRERGEKGAWPEVYDWLWNYQYPRWLEANSWQFLQDQAKNSENWLNFQTTEEIAALPADKCPSLRMPPPETKPTISLNKDLWMVVDLDCSNSQLLLLNRSEQGKCLLCPSFGYAMNAAIAKPPILLPQKDSWAGQTEQKFIFNEVGQEEFVAIVLEKPLDLPWLTPRKEEAIPEWTGERMKQLFEALENLDTYQVFYQSFEVVEAEG
jgi:hypothetical protein